MSSADGKPVSVPVVQAITALQQAMQRVRDLSDGDWAALRLAFHAVQTASSLARPPEHGRKTRYSATCVRCRDRPRYDGHHGRFCPIMRCRHCGRKYSEVDPRTHRAHGPSNLCRVRYGMSLEKRAAGYSTPPRHGVREKASPEDSPADASDDSSDVLDSDSDDEFRSSSSSEDDGKAEVGSSEVSSDA